MARPKQLTYQERLVEIRKDVKLPIPSGLIKTSEGICSYCGYAAAMRGGTLFLCDYYLTTGQMRGCKSGECDKFTMKVDDKKKKLPAF